MVTWCCHVGQQTNDWPSFSPLTLILVGKRVLVCWPNWYIVFGIVHAVVFCTWSYMPQTFCFLVRFGKPYGPVTRGKSIRNHSLCDQMNTGGLWASWCILATWTQELVSISYGFRKVHTAPCGRTGLETPTWSICRAVRSQQAACMRTVRFRTRSIWSAWLSRAFYSRWESLTFGQGLSPTVRAKHCAGSHGIPSDYPDGSARDFHVTGAF